MAGANRSLYELVANMPPNIQPFIALTAEGPVAESYRNLGVEVEIWEPPEPLNRYGRVVLDWPIWHILFVALRYWLPYFVQILRRMVQLRPYVIHANDPRGVVLVGLVAKVLGVPLVAHLRGQPSHGGVFWRLFELLPDKIIAVSENVRNQLQSRVRLKTSAIHNGIQDNLPNPPPIPWLNFLRDHGIVVIACFASVVPFKGYHHLLRAIAKLNAQGLSKRFVVLCIGDFPAEHLRYHEWLFNTQQALHIDNCTFVGFQQSPFAFYHSIDFTVFASIESETLQVGPDSVQVHGSEGFPRTHLEAMIYGLPIVSTDIAGVNEQVVAHKTGYLVPPGDSDALANSMRELIQDQNLRQQMGRTSRQRVLELFSTEKYVKNVLRVYQESSA